MAPSLHVIASCADKKRNGFGEELRLRAFKDRDPKERLRRWWKSLSRPSARVPAQDLYVGPYWSTVRELAASRAKEHFSISVWVASAGYGLISGAAPVRPYSATFRTNAPDAVVRLSDARRGFEAKHWWKALGRLSIPKMVSGARTPLLKGRSADAIVAG